MYILKLVVAQLSDHKYYVLHMFVDRIEEADVQTQTDAFLNRPATPLFIPAKTGADVATQIEEGDVSSFHMLPGLCENQHYHIVVV